MDVFREPHTESKNPKTETGYFKLSQRIWGQEKPHQSKAGLNF